MPAFRIGRSLFGTLPLAFSIATVACGDSGEEPLSEGDGEGSGATCPENSALTYDNFGRAFVENYCTRCHSSALSSSARQGAPSDHNFDDLAEIRALSEHIDEHAAAGPSGVNESMPPSGAKPSEAERRDLGEWLACGSPS